MIRALLLLPVLVCSLLASAQQKNQTTDAFLITGQIKKELRFTLANLQQLQSKSIPDVVITNHAGEPRGTASRLQGILVKDLLKAVELKEENPKLFSEFYFVFTAADEYKVVYSWNEIFNSPTGNSVYLITARDGKNLNEMDDRILIITTSDFKTGRRHIKALSSIVVKRVN